MYLKNIINTVKYL